MRSIPIEEETNVLGLEQGYIGLSVKLANIDVGLASAQDRPASIVTTTVIISKWVPDENELKLLNAGQGLYLHIIGRIHPAVCMTVGMTLDNFVDAANKN